MDFRQELTRLVITALPHLTEENAAPLVQHLLSTDTVGVTGVHELPDVDRSMIPASVLPPIKAKQLITYFQGMMAGTSAPMQQAGSAAVDQNQQQPVRQRTVADIQNASRPVFKFLVPWKSISSTTVDKISEADKDKSRATQEDIDAIKLEIAKKCVVEYRAFKVNNPGFQKHPGVKVYKDIIKQVFSKFQFALMDYINGRIISDGSRTFQRLFSICVENLMRGDSDKTKNKHGLSRSIVGVSVDQYQPLLTAANREIQQGIREHLQNMSQSDPQLWSWDDILKDMKASYDLQRDDVVKAKETVEAEEEEMQEEDADEADGENALEKLKLLWPYLFQPAGLTQHHNRLAERDLGPHLTEYVNTHLDLFVSYLTCSTKKASNKLAIQRFYEKETVQWTRSKKLLLAVLMILSHFNEKRDAFLHVVEKTILTSEVNLSEIKDLCIIAKDLNPIEAASFLICADSIVLVETDTFQSALQAFFECAFVLDIDYPQLASKTMEFIERFILGMGIVSSRVKDRKGKTLLYLTADVRDLSTNYEKFKENMDQQERLLRGE